MNPLVPYVAAMLIGGALFALVGITVNRRSRAVPLTAPSGPPLSTDVINAASIRVAGVGGLGLVAMAAIVAWNLPAIRAAVAAGTAAGVILAVGLIAWRRR